MARKRTISREEESLWRQVTDGIAPLDPLPESPGAEPPGDEIEVKNAGAVQGKGKGKGKGKSKAKPPASPAPPSPAKALPELAPGHSAGIDKRNAQRLKRGQLRPEARVDLHGMIQTEAQAVLNEFIAESYMAGRRNVLVITGKGSVREGGVLRRMVPRWLNLSPLRAMVVAIEQATPRDGGGGAYYLRLRRRR